MQGARKMRYDARECKNVDFRGAGAQQRLGCRGNRRTGRKDIVDEQNRLARNGDLTVEGDAECPANVQLALLGGQAYLLAGRLDPAQGAGFERKTGTARNRSREFGRLIVAPSEKAPVVQRYRYNYIVAADQRGTGAYHPTRHPGSELGLVAIFEALYQLPSDTCMENGSAGASPWRRVSQRLGADHAFAEFMLEGCSCDVADWFGDKMKPRPAVGAKCAAFGDMHAACEAGVRKQDRCGDAARHLRHVQHVNDR